MSRSIKLNEEIASDVNILSRQISIYYYYVNISLNVPRASIIRIEMSRDGQRCFASRPPAYAWVTLFIHCAYIPATASSKAAESIHRSTSIHTLGKRRTKVRNLKPIGPPLFSAAFSDYLFLFLPSMGYGYRHSR